MRIGRCMLLAVVLAVIVAGSWSPSVAGPRKEEAKAAAKQTRSEIKEAKSALKAAGKQVKKDTTQMGKEIKAGFKSAGQEIKQTFTGKSRVKE